MTRKELNSTTSYMDMVRNHREKAFDEGMEAVVDVFLNSLSEGNLELLTLPENPYKIKEKEQNYEKPQV